jgi:hypothetical protein
LGDDAPQDPPALDMRQQGSSPVGVNLITPVFSGPDALICPELDVVPLQPLEKIKQRVIFKVTRILVTVADKYLWCRAYFAFALL